MLEEVDWAHRFDLKSMVHTDYWGRGEQVIFIVHCGGDDGFDGGAAACAPPKTLPMRSW